MRWVRSMACASTAGFHQGSRRNTFSAAVKLRPSPPAFRLTRKSRHSGSVWKRVTRAARSRVLPSRYSYGTPSRSSRARTMASRLVNCEKTSALWPSSRTSASCGRRTSSLALPSSRRAPPRRPGWQAALHGRPAEGQTVLAAQEARGLGRLRPRVLDGLRLVEDHVVEARVLQARRVAPERAVGRDDEVVVLEALACEEPSGPGVVEHLERGREARRLLLPVEDERPWDHDERRPEAP